jgi:hypothetical protein
MKTRIMYIELKTHAGGHNDRGPARIGRVAFNRTGKTLSNRGKRFQKGSTDACANYHDVDNEEGYGISGPKSGGTDRHPCGGGPVEIDDDVRAEYWTEIRKQPKRANERFA